MNNLVYFRGILVGSMIVIVSWSYSLGGSMIVIVSWAIENNLVYFAQKRRLICDCDSLLGC